MDLGWVSIWLGEQTTEEELEKYLGTGAFAKDYGFSWTHRYGPEFQVSRVSLPVSDLLTVTSGAATFLNAAVAAAHAIGRTHANAALVFHRRKYVGGPLPGAPAMQFIGSFKQDFSAPRAPAVSAKRPTAGDPRDFYQPQEIHQHLAAGGDPSARLPSSRDSLMSAARVLDLGLVARLLGEGASVTARDSDGLTALHWAVLTPVRGLRERQQAMGVRMLVEGGSDVNAQTNEGVTP